MKKNTGALAAAIKETGLEVRVNADKTKYMVMSWDQNAGRKNHNIKTDSISFEKVEEVKY